ncbi:hypothetical protein ACLOJK_012214 [Asimina triloba]
MAERCQASRVTSRYVINGDSMRSNIAVGKVQPKSVWLGYDDRKSGVGHSVGPTERRAYVTDL